jgi:hypothetical protein
MDPILKSRSHPRALSSLSRSCRNPTLPPRFAIRILPAEVKFGQKSVPGRGNRAARHVYRSVFMVYQFRRPVSRPATTPGRGERARQYFSWNTNKSVRTTGLPPIQSDYSPVSFDIPFSGFGFQILEFFFKLGHLGLGFYFNKLVQLDYEHLVVAFMY